MGRVAVGIAAIVHQNAQLVCRGVAAQGQVEVSVSLGRAVAGRAVDGNGAKARAGNLGADVDRRRGGRRWWGRSWRRGHVDRHDVAGAGAGVVAGLDAEIVDANGQRRAVLPQATPVNDPRAKMIFQLVM